MIKDYFQNRQNLSPDDIIEFINSHYDFYLYEIIDNYGKWQIEVRYPYIINHTNVELVLEHDFISPRSVLSQPQLKSKIKYIENLISNLT